MTATEAFALVARASFSPFTEADWMGFSGVRSENPLIAEIDDLLLVLDDNHLSVISPNGEETVFVLAGL